ncbi:MAG TPA: type VI secretion system tube protein Hcp, partial [Archangium sp.]
MAETVHLFLKANGADIPGESTQKSLGRENSIECVYYEQEVVTARERGSGLATGRRQYSPLLIRKRIDKSSPLLVKALVENAVVEGKLMFFRPNPTGDGTTE